MAAKASKEFTRLVIEAWNKDLTTLRAQEADFINQLPKLVDLSVWHLQSFNDMCIDDTRCNLIKHAYMVALKTRVIALKRKLHAKAALASFAAKEKSTMDALDVFSFNNRCS